jgi:hypothetical protein
MNLFLCLFAVLCNRGLPWNAMGGNGLLDAGSYLRESGDVEWDADAVVMVHRNLQEPTGEIRSLHLLPVEYLAGASIQVQQPVGIEGDTHLPVGAVEIEQGSTSDYQEEEELAIMKKMIVIVVEDRPDTTSGASTANTIITAK